MFRVEWPDMAFEQMGELIRTHPALAPAFAVGLQRLARDLSQWPDEVGESRPNDRRIAFFGPLVVYYRIVPAERVVRVIAVYLNPHRPGD